MGLKKQMGFFSDVCAQKKPVNYRETPFSFGLIEDVWVAALARPDFGNGTLSNMTYLKEQQVQTIFGLDTKPMFKGMAWALEMDYMDVSIPDFTAPDIDLFERVYEEIIIQASAGKKVAIHCMGGNGRTGTVLAALKLKELLLVCPSPDAVTPSLSMVFLPFGVETIFCTENVKQAVLAIRSIPGNEQAVETEAQLVSLLKYEGFLQSNQLGVHAESSSEALQDSSQMEDRMGL